jgi:hypothetical protein
MVEFHDRREKRYQSVDEVAARLPLKQGDTVGRDLIDGRYLVRGTLNEEGKRIFEIHEALDNGRVIKRGEAEKRYLAKGEASHLTPTSVYDI